MLVKLGEVWYVMTVHLTLIVSSHHSYALFGFLDPKLPHIISLISVLFHRFWTSFFEICLLGDAQDISRYLKTLTCSPLEYVPGGSWKPCETWPSPSDLSSPGWLAHRMAESENHMDPEIWRKKEYLVDWRWLKMVEEHKLMYMFVNIYIYM